MAFPTFGSWISSALTHPGSTTNIAFTADFVNGSASVEYGLFETDGTELLDYQNASDGTNNVNIDSYVGSGETYHVRFRLLGYPDDGFNAVVSDFTVSETDTATMETTNLIEDLDIKLPTTEFNRFSYAPNGSYAHLVQGSYSPNGTDWYGISPFTESTINPTVGSAIYFKATGPDDNNIILDSIRFIIKQDDF